MEPNDDVSAVTPEDSSKQGISHCDVLILDAAEKEER